MTVPSEEEQRLHWRRQWLSSIQAFGDSETQRTRWLDITEPNPHFSFVECMCCYFDDALFGEDDTYQKRIVLGHIAIEEAVAVAEFHTLADAYQSPGGKDWDAQAILDDPAWQAIVRAAEQAMDRLLPLLSDACEREALTQPLRWDEKGGAFHAGLTGSTITPAGQWAKKPVQDGG